MTTRRRLFAGLGGALSILAAPAIIRMPGLLMPIRPPPLIIPPRGDHVATATIADIEARNRAFYDLVPLRDAGGWTYSDTELQRNTIVSRLSSPQYWEAIQDLPKRRPAGQVNGA